LLGDVGAHGVIGKAQEAAQDRVGDGRRCAERAERPGVGERDDTDALAGGEHHGGVEAAPDPVVTDGPVSAGLVAPEPQAHARYPGIGLVVGLEHRGKRPGLEHRAVLVGAAAQQRGGVAGHVAGGGVDRAAAGYRHLAVGDRLEPA
jgi:hypothetical protein